jgi:hypothetical protein
MSACCSPFPPHHGPEAPSFRVFRAPLAEFQPGFFLAATNLLKFRRFTNIYECWERTSQANVQSLDVQILDMAHAGFDGKILAV